jgi:hypothetical protein
MNRKRVGFLAGMEFALVIVWSAAAWAASPATTYLDQLSQAVGQTGQSMDAYTASAQKAADRIMKGGQLLLGGDQRDFKSETIGRAGGLMGFHFVGKKFVPKAGDVVLTSSVERWTPTQVGEMQKWIADGAQVILFSADVPADLKSKVDAFVPAGASGVHIDGKFYPLDSAMNIVDMWVWTAEYVSAATRKGKMPVLYQSFFVEGARERAKKYTGQTFHSDFKIAPIEAGKLGNDYLTAIEGELKAVEGEASTLAEASKWLQSAPKDKSVVIGIGHTFPYLYQDPRAPQPFGAMLQWTKIQKTKDVPAGTSLVFHVGYRNAPDVLLEQAKAGQYKLIYFSVEEGTTKADNILYINPHWPPTDACVTVKGYDIPILPPSGVMQAAIYWSVVAGAN